MAPVAHFASLDSDVEYGEKGTLLAESIDESTSVQSQPRSLWLLLSLALNVLLASGILALCLKIDVVCAAEPAIGIWSPANEAVEYIKEQPFRAALFNKTEYMGYPTDETDRLWEELYNFGTSVITEEQASKLPMPTLNIPGTKDYLIQLDVWHQLHCLNDLRKIIYPERFPGLEELTVDGVVDRGSSMFMHWDHCLDSLRQVLMCHADVSPISFHINEPVRGGIFPRLATTHTCRNFSKIQDWAKTHSAGSWNYNITAEQADEIVRTAHFDQSPLEDIEFLWESFPGNLFFQHWRDEANPV